ncbi:cyclic nucleotide-binding domain-containing protein [Desertibaculum subflavum]|uniref:cyclic nucleotide-binding domain-containing protein n=1 Tax=Desertibaculum subflavum TaxID=2268458 RepID=UPI000E6664D8
MTITARSTPAIDLAIAGSPREITAIQRFRYQVLVEAQGGESADADRKHRIVADAVDAAAQHLFVRTITGALAATVRLIPAAIDVLPPAGADALRLGGFLNFGRQAACVQDRLVVGEAGAAGIMATLLGGAVRVARQIGARFLCTAVPASQVKAFEQLGYRGYAEGFVDRDDQYLVPLVLLTEDYIHLATVNSPFARLIVREDNPRTTADWFAKTYPAPSRTGAKGVSEDQIWERLTQTLRQSPLEGIPLLHDLSYADARRFVGVGRLKRCHTGDVLVRQGDVGRDMFVVIGGEVEVRRIDRKGASKRVAALGRGDVFGEMAYLSEAPRTADVVALTEGEVLVLNQQTMQRAIQEMPAVAARVLFNLSLILSDRLGKTTAKLV